jgi:hypothetical protein
MEMSGQIHVLADLPSKETWCGLDRRLSDPRSRSRRCGEDKCFLPLPGIELGFIGDHRVVIHSHCCGNLKSSISQFVYSRAKYSDHPVSLM